MGWVPADAWAKSGHRIRALEFYDRQWTEKALRDIIVVHAGHRATHHELSVRHQPNYNDTCTTSRRSQDAHGWMDVIDTF